MKEGDKILGLLATTGMLRVDGPQGLKSAIDSLYEEDINPGFYFKIIYSMHEFGFLEYSQDERKIYAISPSLSPSLINPNNFYLTGTWGPGFFDKIKNICESKNIKFKIIPDEKNKFLPIKIIITIKKLSDLNNFHKIGCKIFKTPLSFSLLNNFEKNQLNEDAWVGTRANDLEFFNPQTLKFNLKKDNIENNQIILSRRLKYERLYVYNLFKKINNKWMINKKNIESRNGKWIQLKGKRIPYNPVKRSIATPIMCPLPLDVSRIISIGSYEKIVDIENDKLKTFYNINHNEFRVFSNIPTIIANKVAECVSCKLENFDWFQS